MNRRPGIDDEGSGFALLVKLNLPFDGAAQAIDVLTAIERVRRDRLDPARRLDEVLGPTGEPLGPLRAVADLKLNLLVGFGLRFFAGPLTTRPAYEPVANFPPGGAYAPRIPTRFGLQRPIPLYLRTMAAAGDDAWVRKRLTAAGAPADDAAVASALQTWLARGESDLLLQLESNNQYLVTDLWEALRRDVVVSHGLEVVRVHACFHRGDRRDHTGWKDGTSNLQEMQERDPSRYRRHIYLPHPAPGYPGESIVYRDPPAYDGGTYWVHRKYVEHLDRWMADDFVHTDADGVTHHGEDARAHAVGRDRASGCVIHRRTAAPLSPEPDSTETMLAPMISHIAKARGANPAPFIGPFPPLAVGETNVFNIQDIRIRRRGFPFAETCPHSGATVYGQHFMCFQNNIQQTGFEFINNIWLLNPCFRTGVDPLFDVETGIIEPVEGAYYFIPPEHRTYPGEVFFADRRGA